MNDEHHSQRTGTSTGIDGRDVSPYVAERAGRGGPDRADVHADEDIDARSEHTFIQRRDLGLVDVAALIINKQIGTGIFTTPGLVLFLTGSKTISLVLWLCGGIWSFLSVIIYVEFGSAFPFNGGELIYLDEVLKRPELFATTLFSAIFLFTPNTNGNSLQFAKHVLLAAEPGVTETQKLDQRLISYVATTVLAVVCLIHYFSRNSGLFLNQLFALYKIILVLVVAICGIAASGHMGNGKSDWGQQPGHDRHVLAALVYVIYSYQGWENANYVGGELKVKSQALKWGAFLAVGTVTVLYCLATLAYQLVCPFGELVDQDLGVVSHFAPKVFGESGVLGLKICIALSAFGNLVAVVYTSSKVKQQIARQCILPFYRFWGRDSPAFMTPDGALILQWTTAVIWILCTPNTADGYGFVIGIFVYGQVVISMFLAFAFFFIRHCKEAGDAQGRNGGPMEWKPVILTNKTLRYLAGIAFAAMNIMVIAEAPQAASTPPAWLWPAVVFGDLGVGIIYWATIRLIEKNCSAESPISIRIVAADTEDLKSWEKQALEQAILQGNSRVVIYEVRGTLQKALRWINGKAHKTYRILTR